MDAERSEEPNPSEPENAEFVVRLEHPDGDSSATYWVRNQR